jgi:hypothetical protein
MKDTFQIIREAGPIKRTVTLDLGDCDETYRGAVFDVWVAPTRAHLAQFAEYKVWLDTEPGRRQKQRDAIEDKAEREEFDRVMGEQLDNEMYRRLDAWLADTWLNIDLDAVTQIRDHLQETYPAAWNWLYSHTLRAMRDYRENLTKN